MEIFDDSGKVCERSCSMMSMHFLSSVLAFSGAFPALRTAASMRRPCHKVSGVPRLSEIATASSSLAPAHSGLPTSR